MGPSEQVHADGLRQAGAVVTRGRRRISQPPAQRAHLVALLRQLALQLVRVALHWVSDVSGRGLCLRL